MERNEIGDRRLETGDWRLVKARIGLMFYGATGLMLAALFYFAALEIAGVLEYLPLVPEQGIIIFLLILGLALVEMGGTVFAMVWLAARVPIGVLDVIAAVYVAVGGLYVLGYGVFSSDVRGVQVFGGLVVVRWFLLLFVPLEAEKGLGEGDG